MSRANEGHFFVCRRRRAQLLQLKNEDFDKLAPKLAAYIDPHNFCLTLAERFVGLAENDTT